MINLLQQIYLAVCYKLQSFIHTAKYTSFQVIARVSNIIIITANLRYFLILRRVLNNTYFITILAGLLIFTGQLGFDTLIYVASWIFIKNTITLLHAYFCGWTFLHWAAFNGHIDIVKLLIEKHANVNVTDKHGRTPLYLSLRYGYEDIVETLLEHGAINKLDINN